MTAPKFDIGDKVRLTCALTDITGAAADPTTVVCTVRAPDNTTSTPSVMHPGLGSYYSEVTTTQSGTYFYRFEGTGALVVAEEGQFYVRERNV